MKCIKIWNTVYNEPPHATFVKTSRLSKTDKKYRWIETLCRKRDLLNKTYIKLTHFKIKRNWNIREQAKKGFVK